MSIFQTLKTSGWSAGEVEDGSAHVEPVGDLVEHLVDDCPCGPRVQPVKRDDGSVGWLVVHHSLDGREINEPDREVQGG